MSQIRSLVQELPYTMGAEKKKKKEENYLKGGSSHHGSVEINPSRNHEVAGSIPGLAQWLKVPVSP